MTVTTEEAEELVKGAFMLMDDPPDPDGEIMLGSGFLTDLATALRSLAAERDALRAENARLREALRPFIQTGNVQGGYRVKLDGQEPPPITASEEEAWAHYGGSDFYYQQWLQWRAVQIGRELLGEKE